MRRQGAEESVEGERQQQRQKGVGDENAGEEEDTGRGEEEEAGAEGSRLTEGSAAPRVAEEDEAEDGEGKGKVDGEGGCATVGRMRRGKKFEAHGGEPVGKRRLFQVADAVDVEGDPVSSGEHGLGGLGVRGVGVVEERRSESRGDVEQEPKADQYDEVGAGPANRQRGMG